VGRGASRMKPGDLSSRANCSQLEPGHTHSPLLKRLRLWWPSEYRILVDRSARHSSSPEPNYRGCESPGNGGLCLSFMKSAVLCYLLWD
jgi:hypothetical protein